MRYFRRLRIQTTLKLVIFGLVLSLILLNTPFDIPNLFGQTSAQSLVISSISTNRVTAGSIVTLTVDGMVPNGDIIVIFFKPQAFRRGVNSEVTAPGFSPDGKNVEVAAPFFLNGPIEIQVLENTPANELSSNYFKGLRVLPPPAAGTVTLGFLQGNLQLLQAAVQQADFFSSDVNLRQYLTNELVMTQNSIECVQAVLQKPSQECQIETVAGTTIDLTAPALRLADRAILGLLAAQSNASNDPNNAAAGYVRAFTRAESAQQRQAAVNTYFENTENSLEQIASATGSSAGTTNPQDVETAFRTNALVDGGVLFTAGLYTNTPLLAQTLAAAALTAIAYAGSMTRLGVALANAPQGDGQLSNEIVADLSLESFVETIAASISGLTYSVNQNMFNVFATLLQDLTTATPTPVPAPSTPGLPTPHGKRPTPTPAPIISPASPGPTATAGVATTTPAPTIAPSTPTPAPPNLTPAPTSTPHGRGPTPTPVETASSSPAPPTPTVGPATPTPAPTATALSSTPAPPTMTPVPPTPHVNPSIPVSGPTESASPAQATPTAGEETPTPTSAGTTVPPQHPLR